MSDNILKCEKLVKKFGNKTILKEVSFSLDRGDILGFIGPNGAGKTTTIKLILGLQSITKGKVYINGYDVEKNFVKAIKNVGAIVESPDAYMYLTGRQNLELSARAYGKVDKNKIDELVKLTGLSKRIDDKVGKYSLGMRQRLGIADAMLSDPSLLILDEPTNGLDPEGIKELRDLLVKLAKEKGMAILVSSHNLSELESFCNKVCIIKNGEVIESSDVKTLKKENVKNEYILELDKTTGLNKVLKKYDYKIEGNLVVISLDREEVSNLLLELLDNKYKVYQCAEKEQSLEDAFLKKVGGNIID